MWARPDGEVSRKQSALLVRIIIAVENRQRGMLAVFPWHVEVVLDATRVEISRKLALLARGWRGRLKSWSRKAICKRRTVFEIQIDEGTADDQTHDYPTSL